MGSSRPEIPTDKLPAHPGFEEQLRRVTRESVQLISYHRELIAEYHEASGRVTVFAGHHGNVSKTVNTYISRVVKLAGERKDREVILTELSPNVRMRPVAVSAENIGNDVGRGRELSGAEKRIQRRKNEALRNELRKE